MDSRTFFIFFAHRKVVVFFFYLFVAFFVLYGCTFTPIPKNNPDPTIEVENTIDIELDHFDYAVDEKVLLIFKVNDNQEKHYIDYYSFNYENNTALASGEWIKRNDGSNLYDYHITATVEGQTDFKVSYQYKSGDIYTSETISLTFEYKKISNADDLLLLNDSRKSFKLSNDIDLSEFSSWTPISGFSGKLYGNNFAIENLHITSSTGDNVGLFSILEGEVYDLILRDVEINLSNAYNNVGALAGTSLNTLNNIRVTGVVNAPSYKNVGGLVGVAKSVTLTNNSSACSVTGLDYVGGLFGRVEKEFTTLKDNLNIGMVQGNTGVGGISGYIDTSNKQTIDHNINEGSIRGLGNDVGGVVGLVGGSISSYKDSQVAYFTNNENKGVISSQGNHVGGLVGRHNTKNTSTSTQSYQLYLSITSANNSGNVTGNDFVGGVIGFGTFVSNLTLSNNLGSITGSTYVGGYVGKAAHIIISGLVNEQQITGTSYVGGIAGYANRITDSTNHGLIQSTGVTFEGSLGISYVGGIAGYAFGMSDCINTMDLSITTQGAYVGGLAGAININSLPTLDGNTNEGNIYSTGQYVGGLYGSLLGNISSYSNNQVSLISNNTNNGNVTSTNDYVGGLIGYQYTQNTNTGTLSYQLYASIMNSENNGVIQGKSYAGGLLGYGRFIKDVHYNKNTANVSGENYVGGFIGRADHSYINQAINNSVITGKSYVGGIAGYAKQIDNARNLGEIISTGVTIEGSLPVAYVGGIAGYVYGLKNSVNESDITVTTQGAYVGGLVGVINGVNLPEISGNSNKGDVTSNFNYVGGLAGAIIGTISSYNNNQNIILTNNQNEGNITTTGDYVGGLIGYQKSSNTSTSTLSYQLFINISNSNNSGHVSGNDYVGGILGYGTFVFGATSIWDTNISGGTITGTTHFGNKYGYIKTTK